MGQVILQSTSVVFLTFPLKEVIQAIAMTYNKKARQLPCANVTIFFCHSLSVFWKNRDCIFISVVLPLVCFPVCASIIA